jgi:hypothetical protein
VKLPSDLSSPSSSSDVITTAHTTYFDAFPLFSTLSISFFSSTNLLMMDGQFSSIARRKFDETANGAATGTEK